MALFLKVKSEMSTDWISDPIVHRGQPEVKRRRKNTEISPSCII